VVNELDAIVNIDLHERLPKEDHKTLNLIRIGTSGAMQEEIPVDTPVISEISVGFDGLLNFYANRDKLGNSVIEQAFVDHTDWNSKLAAPYFVNASELLVNKIGYDMIKGITISAPGFYGPQGRVLRLDINDPGLNEKLTSFEYKGKKITNFEMESSAIAGLAKLLGHNALTVCSIIANRIRKEYSQDYKVGVDKLIKTVLDRLSA
jgi:uridine phosphorylase